MRSQSEEKRAVGLSMKGLHEEILHFKKSSVIAQ